MKHVHVTASRRTAQGTVAAHDNDEGDSARRVWQMATASTAAQRRMALPAERHSAARVLQLIREAHPRHCQPQGGAEHRGSSRQRRMRLHAALSQMAMASQHRIPLPADQVAAQHRVPQLTREAAVSRRPGQDTAVVTRAEGFTLRDSTRLQVNESTRHCGTARPNVG